MSHSTLIQRGMDLQKQFQAAEEERFLEHLRSSVQVNCLTEERGLDF